MPLDNTPYLAPATNGGQGSFNYGDTSRYGPRELRREIPDYGGQPVIPGGGGGAKAAPATYGGRGGPTPNPNGIVIIRLFRIE